MRRRPLVSAIIHVDDTVGVGPLHCDKAIAVAVPAVPRRHPVLRGRPIPTAVAGRGVQLHGEPRGLVPSIKHRRLDVHGEPVGGAGLQVDLLLGFEVAEAEVLRVDNLEGPGGLVVPVLCGHDLAAPAVGVVVVPCPGACEIGCVKPKSRGRGWQGGDRDAGRGGHCRRDTGRRHCDGGGCLNGVCVGYRGGRGRTSDADRLGGDTEAGARRGDAVGRIQLGGDTGGRGNRRQGWGKSFDLLW